jgi:hypothetical protein
LLPQSLLNQYLTVARLHGYALVPRPTDVVELATDALTYRLDTVASPGAWPIIPPVEDIRALQKLREAVAEMLKLMWRRRWLHIGELFPSMIPTSFRDR